MKLKSIVVTFLLLILSGCTSFYPLPLKEPSALDKGGARTTPDYQRGGLLPAKNIGEGIENLKIYGDAYQDYSDKLRQNEYVSSDTALAGGVLGVIGGVAKSAETALAGAVLGSGASVISERYQFLVQATNYENASDAMYCMYRHLYSVSGGGLSAPFVNERIDEVRRKLRKSQSSVQLASPDLTKLETSLSDVINRKENKKHAEAQLLAKVANAQAAFDQAQTEYLMAELSKCVAAF